MNRVMRFFDRLPSWTLGAVATVLVLWLTLSPLPLLGLRQPDLFGIDKAEHALMFAMLLWAWLLDALRKRRRTLPAASVWALALAVALLGIATECGQLFEPLHRYFEWADIVADVFGALVGALAWFPLQRYLTKTAIRRR